MGKAESLLPVDELPESVYAELWFSPDDVPSADAVAAHSLAALLAELQGLRPFPAVAHKVLDLVNRPDFEVRQLQSLVEEDPSLATRVLRVANSAAFRTREPCATIHQAIIRMGTRTITEVVSSVAVMEAFQDLGGVGRSIRDHCAAVGATLRTLAARKDPFLTGLFLAGLLHDMGKLLLLQTQDDSYTTLAARFLSIPDEAHEREREQIGFDHAVLAGHVLRAWGLPEPLPRIVAWHHQPSRIYEDRGPVGLMVALLRLVDKMETRLRDGGKPDASYFDSLARSPDAQRAELGARDLRDAWPLLLVAHQESRTLFG